MMRLRRKLTDMSNDNGLLTQNFLMVQARYREVRCMPRHPPRVAEIWPRPASAGHCFRSLTLARAAPAPPGDLDARG